MKKILGILSSLSLLTSASAAVLACGTDKDDSAIEDTGLTEDERNQVLNQFRAETARLATSHIQANRSGLYVSRETSAQYVFLNYDNLSSKVDPEKEGDLTIFVSDSEFSALNSDVDSILKINGELQQQVQTIISENSAYNFLLLNVDKILSGFSIARDNIRVETQPFNEEGGTETEGSFTVSFDISFNFNYVWNGSSEVYTTTATEIKFLVLPDKVLQAGVLKIVNNIASALWANDTEGIFNFSEKDLAPEGQEESRYVFGNQANSVQTYFSNNEFPAKLREAVNNVLKTIVDDSAFDPQTAFSYGSVGAQTAKRLYVGQLRQAIVTNGFFDQTMFMKNPEATPESVDAAFESDFASSFGRTGFVAREAQTIKNTYGIELDTNKTPEFVEYGEVKLEELSLKVLGVEIDLNPISLLYVYNPIKTFAQRSMDIFKNWQEQWGISSSNDRYALFKISESKDAGKAFFAANLSRPFEFTSGSNSSVYFPSTLRTGSGINAFYFSQSNSERNPYAARDSLGYSINYSGYVSGPFQNNPALYERSWILTVTIGEVKITINFAQNKDYFSNLWVGRGSANPTTKYVVERGK